MKLLMKKMYIFAFFLTLVLVACTGPTESIETSPVSVQPTPTTGEAAHSALPTPTSPQPTDTPTPKPSPSPTVASPASTTERIAEAATNYLADELDVSPEEIRAVAIEPEEWSDASLGCPKPGQSYAQVVTPGYRVLVRVGEKEYEVHTDQAGEVAVLCERKLEKGPAAAVDYLAEELGVSSEEIEVLSVEMYEWPDASMGCPEPGKSYAQVLTTGYRVILQAQGKKYELHVDQEGEHIVVCD